MSLLGYILIYFVLAIPASMFIGALIRYGSEDGVKDE